jgi:hypothetical protein
VIWILGSVAFAALLGILFREITVAREVSKSDAIA